MVCAMQSSRKCEQEQQQQQNNICSALQQLNQPDEQGYDCKIEFGFGMSLCDRRPSNLQRRITNTSVWLYHEIRDKIGAQWWRIWEFFVLGKNWMLG